MAYVLDGDSRLLATGALASSQAVTNGNPFTLTAIDITSVDVASGAPTFSLASMGSTTTLYNVRPTIVYGDGTTRVVGKCTLVLSKEIT